MDLDLNAAIRDRSQERAALLSMHGYPADYLELTYDCPLCRDTGYINGTQKCACFKKAAVDLLYRPARPLLPRSKKARRSSAISARRLKISSFTATPVSEKRFFRTVLPAS